MKHNPSMTCAREGFGVSSSSCEGVTTATPTRHFSGTFKFLRCSMYGLKFKTSDEAHQAMTEHGYTEPYYRRRSVPLPTFANLKFVREECKFDAQYRLYKWMGRNGLNRQALRDKLAIMVKRGVHHPAAKQFKEQL